MDLKALEVDLACGCRFQFPHEPDGRCTVKANPCKKHNDWETVTAYAQSILEELDGKEFYGNHQLHARIEP